MAVESALTTESGRARAIESGVYFDPRDGRALTQSDGCDLETWKRVWPKAAFCRHPKGFPVFLAPALVEVKDEYSGGDPYALEGAIGSDFHVRRIDTTIDLLKQGLRGRAAGAEVRILDIACGEGHITDRIRKAFAGSRLYGIDHSVTAIERAVDRYPEIEFAAGDAYELPYAPGSFDAVVLNNIYEHVPDPVRLMTAVQKVMKPGGHVVISTPSRYRFGNLMRVLRGKPISFMSSYHVTEYTIGQVKEQLRFAGYEVVRAEARPVKGIRGGPARWVVEHVAKPGLRVMLKMAGSHHSLEGTVFYLARDRRSLKDVVAG